MCIFAIAAHSIFFFRLAWAPNINVFYYFTHHSCVQCIVANRNSIWSLSMRYIRSRIFFKPYIIKYCTWKYVSQCIFTSPIIPCVCAYLYTRFISHSVALTRNYSFGIESFRPACLTDWLCISSSIAFTHSLTHQLNQKMLILFPLLFLDLPIAFAALSNGFIIHLVWYESETPEKLVGACHFFVSSTSLLIKDGYSFRFSCPI